MSKLQNLVERVIAIVGLIAISPILLVAAILIWLEDHGPILFKQERVGWHGRLFRMYKLRSMRVSTIVDGAQLTVGADQRITKTGRFLRMTKLDEAPQLFNVVKGEMSLVGPRPEVQRYVDRYSQDERQVLNLRPGITDPSSLKYFDESSLLAEAKDPEDHYCKVIMPDKIGINLKYAAKRTLASDLLVIFYTLARVLGYRADLDRLLR